MGLFEEYPWLLVPFVIATIEGWAALKAFVRRADRRDRPAAFKPERENPRSR
jgi:hypothetical protein